MIDIIRLDRVRNKKTDCTECETVQSVFVWCTYRLDGLYLAYEMCADPRFFGGQAVFFFAEGDAFHQECHVAGKGSHRLESFGIFVRFARCASVDTVPILTGGDRHTADCEEFVQLVKRGRESAPTSGDNSRSDLHRFVEGGAEKQSGQEGDECCVGRGIVDRTADDQTVARGEFFGGFIDGIVENALAELCAFATSDTAAYRLIADMEQFDFDVFLGEYLLHFG